ncbi:ribonuclease Z [Armatimonas rosea]|uniref:Ribonuclease Z n=1 Tax=Armatimonas rosea TaxID=685828 RepID=A0A7W9W9B5_ARMRO|nr:ribonuclease Z [Armatimonas rosea]
MEITFLGTGSGAPSRARNVSATALHLPQRGEWWLIDCGEGTQHQILRASHIRLSQLTRIFLTHLHGDHLFGLPGLLASRALAQGGVGPITIYGPDGVEAWLKATLRVSGMRFGFPVTFVTVKPGEVCTDGEFTVTAAPVRHRIEAYAFAVREAEQAGRFDVAAAAALGIPPGPLYGQLKAGKTVTLDDGRVIEGSALVGPTRPGRCVVFSGDTGPAPELAPLAKGADLLIHEATYSELDRGLADRAAHATATVAAEVAREAGVHSLLLTHFSARYEGGESEVNLETLLSEARAIFPETRLAYDQLRVSVPRREQ